MFPDLPGTFVRSGMVRSCPLFLPVQPLLDSDDDTTRQRRRIPTSCFKNTLCNTANQPYYVWKLKGRNEK
jgi:hypothetical protein